VRPLFLTLLLFPILLVDAALAAQNCKSRQGNLCFAISGGQMKRINGSPAFQRALKAVAAKMGSHQVVIYQGYRSPSDQAAIVRRLCGAGRSSCSGAASPSTSRHVVSIAADPMVRGNVVKPLCHAENQARVEHLGPRSAAAVYGYSNGYTWGHLDDSTGSNYTPRNCGRNEGLNGAIAVRDTASSSWPAANAAEPGQRTSPRVDDYKRTRQEKRAKPSRSKPASRPDSDSDWVRELWGRTGS
jgi:hypothetical protein